MINAYFMFISFNSVFSYPKKPSNRNTANSNNVPNIILYTLESTVKKPPKNENGIDVMANR